MTVGRQKLPSLLGLLLVTAGLLAATAVPASAHSVLLSTTPAAAASIRSAPAAVMLMFNEQPHGQYSTIHVIGPDGARRDSGPVRVLNDTVTEELGGSRPEGRYVVDWHVTSADGHPVSGQFSYTSLTAAATLAARQPDASSAPQKHSGGTSTGIVIAVVAAVIGVAGLVLFLVRGRRPARAGSSLVADDGD